MTLPHLELRSSARLIHIKRNYVATFSQQEFSQPFALRTLRRETRGYFPGFDFDAPTELQLLPVVADVLDKKDLRVYQAAGTKLGRRGAIKFLPEAFSNDSERVARFQREARVLATLSHPNIAAIYGVEEIDGRHFLVMELVPGETLAASEAARFRLKNPAGDFAAFEKPLRRLHAPMR